MAYKEKIDYLLIDVRELEKLIAGMRDADMYPVSFFSQSFELTHKILKDLHALETVQVELLRKQMEEHAAVLKDLPYGALLQRSQEVNEAVPDRSEEEIEREVFVKKMPDPVVTLDEPEPVKEKVEKEVLFEEPVGEVVSSPVDEIKPVAPITLESPLLEEAPIDPFRHGHLSFSSTSVLSEKVAPQNLSVNESIEKKKFSDFRKALSLNDRFYFRRELFNGNEARMNQVIDDLNGLHSYEESLAYLKQELAWNLDDQAVADFVKLLEKRFA
ncbi:hypothetical protein [Parabacteroides pacaensis]|uniref:hypothetical protein n=1 Tax=Parabacteroides pacaensis TaxID=2086575 RepID=UPI000D0FDCB0|nr:hypothetical protein [Parabacteroides pacaensis]